MNRVQSPDYKRVRGEIAKKYCGRSGRIGMILADRILAIEGLGIRPKGVKVICLCGSTRFTPEMLVKQWELTKQGNIVLSWCALPDNYFKGEDKTHIGDQEGVKAIVDEVHKRKIDLSDEVLVITSGEATQGMKHIGESTYSEMSYARSIGKPIHFYPHEQALEDNWN